EISEEIERDGSILLGFHPDRTARGHRLCSNPIELFHCPAIKGQQLENGVPWVWAFDCHKVGYGINSYFDCFWPYLVGSVTVGGIKFDTGPWFKRSSVKSPADNFLIGDGMPKADGYWSSSCWWPNACMNPKTDRKSTR